MTGLFSVAGLAGSGTARAEAGAKADVDYTSFLKLLIASMKNQDPTKPNDPSETLSQLASFSNVEQGIKLNEKLDRLLSASGAGEMAALMGKKVSSLDGAVTGLVESVELGRYGVVLILEDGGRLRIEDGFRIIQDE